MSQYKLISIAPVFQTRMLEVMDWVEKHRLGSICFSQTIYGMYFPKNAPLGLDQIPLIAIDLETAWHYLEGLGKPLDLRQDLALSVFTVLASRLVPNSEQTYAHLLGLEFERRKQDDQPAFRLIPEVASRPRLAASIASTTGRFDRPSWKMDDGRTVVFTNTASDGKPRLGNGTYAVVRSAQLKAETGETEEIAVKKFVSDPELSEVPGGKWIEAVSNLREYRVAQLAHGLGCGVGAHFLVDFNDSKHADRRVKMGMPKFGGCLQGHPFMGIRVDAEFKGLSFAKKSGYRTWFESLRLEFLSLLTQLSRLHDNGILHGDIKAKNVMGIDRLVWGDFGSVSSTQYLAYCSGRRQTQTYPAPEAFAKINAKLAEPGRTKDQNIHFLLGLDIWALGLMFGFLAVDPPEDWNEFVFNPQTENLDDFKSKLGQQLPLFLVHVSHIAGVEYARMVGRCLNLDPDKRIGIHDLVLHPAIAQPMASKFDSLDNRVLTIEEARHLITG